jgi:demethylmenaquinone methyltransferase/2-methoxy-6-polyprenyl-1,4-benzoquinol methylase
MNKKGHAFTGIMGGANYKRWAALFGMGNRFYRRGIGSLTLAAGMKALDLGCGPGALSFALAEVAHPTSVIYGLDISEDQLNYARARVDRFKCKLVFKNASMDEIPFANEHFDLVMTSMAIHETPPEVRRNTIRETARVLKKGGLFILVDWSRPRFGLWGIVWLPFTMWGELNKDNWKNVYPELCRRHGLILQEGKYINSMVLRQVFKRGEGQC